MERATKLIVFGWACAALALEVHLVARGWGELQTIVLCAFIGAAVLSACSRKAIALVLVFTYLFPVLIRAFHGEYHPYFGTLWMAPLLGVLAPDSVTTSWHIPRRWR